MADCEETLRELDAFLDGELTADDLSLVRSHLDGCMDCLQAYDFDAELRVRHQGRSAGSRRCPRVCWTG